MAEMDNQETCPECRETLQSSANLGGRDRWTAYCPECGWSEDDEKEDHELFG